MWIHPDGRVVASMFLSFQGDSMRAEAPLQVLNSSSKFLVVEREEPNETRFYNKASIVRVEYMDEDDLPEDGVKPLDCVTHMMDGALIKGKIERFLPPDNSRLYDYLNIDDEHFVKLKLEDGMTCLINKSYIVRVSPK